MFSEFYKSSNVKLFLPDSLLQNEDTLLLKTLKIGIFARIFAIYRIKEIFFYQDNSNQEEIEMLKIIFSYVFTPPYLKRLFKKTPLLKYASILPPIQTPNHVGVNISNTFYKEGIIIDKKEKNSHFEFLINIGNKKPIKLTTKNDQGDSLNINQLISIAIKNNNIEIFDYNNSDHYWKSKFIFLQESIFEYIKKNALKEDLVIAASKHGESLSIHQLESLIMPIKGNHKIFLLFGPLKGFFKEYFIKNKINYSFIDFWINFIREQGTLTVKLEEAIIATLSILNYF